MRASLQLYAFLSSDGLTRSYARLEIRFLEVASFSDARDRFRPSHGLLGSNGLPAKLHMTVPKSFRRNGELPRVLVLHFAVLLQSDIGVAHGVRVTKPMRTILDLLAGGEVPLATLRQAVREGLRRGLIRRSEITEAWKHFAEGKQLRSLFQRVVS
jgi:hypothetical protein